MTLSEEENARLRVCSAILTLNRRDLEWAVSLDETVIGSELLGEARSCLQVAPVPGRHGLVHLAHRLPVRLQYVGQRVVLFFPRLARRVLRTSGLHHRMF